MKCDKCSDCEVKEYCLSFTREEWSLLVGKTFKDIQYDEEFECIRVMFDDDVLYIAMSRM